LANSTGFVGTQKVWQEWYEVSTGLHARLIAGALIGLTTDDELVQIKMTTAGNIHVEMQPSTESVGYVTLGSSNNHAGQVGGNSAFPSAAIAVTTSGAYSSGDVMGASVTFSGCFRSTDIMSGILQSVVVTDLSTAAQSAIDLWLFQTVTTGTTYTNDSALTLADADIAKLVAKVSISSGDYYQFANNAAAVVSNLGLPIRATTGTGLTGVAICRSTGPQYASTGDLNVTLGILQD